MGFSHFLGAISETYWNWPPALGALRFVSHYQLDHGEEIKQLCICSLLYQQVLYAIAGFH
jgi:hypothetical protein